MEHKKLIILYVDDEDINLRAFKSSFRREFTIYTASSASEGLKILQSEKVDVVITDQRMPDTSGVEFLKQIQELLPSIPPSRLMLSGFSKTQAIEDAYTNYNLFKFISKPWNKKDIRQLIHESVKTENYTPAEKNVIVENLKNEKYNILYVDDEGINLRTFETNFRRDFNVFKAISPKEGFKILKENKIHAVISDQRMPEMSGIEFLKKVKNEHPNISLILLTGYTDYEPLKDAINNNTLWGYLNKPYDYDYLKSTINKGIDSYQLKNDKDILNKELDFRRERLDKMMDTALDGIITIDENQYIIDINRAACKLFGYKFEDLIGKPITLLIPKEKKTIQTEQIKAFNLETNLTEKTGSHMVIIGFTSAGEKVWLESSFSKQENHGQYYYHAFIRDVTEKLKTQKKLKENEFRLKKAQRIAHIGYWNYDHINKKHYWSDELFRILNMLPKEIQESYETYSDNIHPDDKDRFQEIHFYAIEFKKPFNISYRLLFNDSSIKYVQHIVEFGFDPSSNTSNYFGTVQDITSKVLTEQKLNESEERFKLAMKGANDGLWDYNIVDNTIYYSPRYKQMLGYEDTEFKNDINSWYELIHPDDAEKALQEVDTFLNATIPETNYASEFRLKHKNGSYLNILSRAYGVHSESGELIRVIGTHTDITPLKNIENKLLKLNSSLEKKVTLRTRKLENANELLKEQHRIIEIQKKNMISEVKEIHHRVKNNLQIVNSLLSLQSRKIEDKKTLNIFKEVQNRVISMSLLHETLYRTDDLKNINIENHFKELVKNLLKNYKVEKIVALDINIENLHFGLKTLVPLGLIINEIITNSLKYAFKNSENGVINISLIHIEGLKYQLLIGDDGIGITKEVWEKESTSLGKKLIYIFTKQLNGSIELLDKSGTNFKILFEDIDL